MLDRQMPFRVKRRSLTVGIHRKIPNADNMNPARAERLMAGEVRHWIAQLGRIFGAENVGNGCGFVYGFRRRH